MREKIRYLIGLYRIPYYAIFKVAVPFALTFLQLYFSSAILIQIMKNRGAYINNRHLTLIVLFAFFAFLIFLPKLASFLEFIIHPLYFFACSRYGCPSSDFLFYVAIVFSTILILSKIIFYFTFILDDKLNPKDDFDYAEIDSHWD